MDILFKLLLSFIELVSLVYCESFGAASWPCWLVLLYFDVQELDKTVYTCKIACQTQIS